MSCSLLHGGVIPRTINRVIARKLWLGQGQTRLPRLSLLDLHTSAPSSQTQIDTGF